MVQASTGTSTGIFVGQFPISNINFIAVVDQIRIHVNVGDGQSQDSVLRK
jgi:hypothetical protein